MEITFSCGVVAKNVGAPSMSMQHHLQNCDNEACQQELPAKIKEYDNVFLPW